MIEELASNYEERKKNEILHYEQVFNGRMYQEVPNVWDEVERHFADCLENAAGVRNLYQFVGRYTNNKKKVSILGLGSGACGNELDGIVPLLKQNGCEVELVCVDINESALKQAEEESEKRCVKFTAISEDVNKLYLRREEYDVVVAYASLHHFIELDHVAAEINKSLTQDGIFVTVDIPTRNGYKMWDETYDVVNKLWRTLPPKFKIDHTGFIEPKYIETYYNTDYSQNSFECINSEAIIPALRKHLNELYFVPALSIARRFFDTKFGPNYDMNNKLDNSIFNYIINLDAYYINSKILKPETFFGAYSKKVI